MHPLTDPPDDASKIGEPGVLDAHHCRGLSCLHDWSLALCETGGRIVALSNTRSGLVGAVD